VGGAQVLANHRLVIRKEIDVKASPAAAAKSIGTLNFDSAVRLVRAEGAFSLVEWRGKGGVVLPGWVYSRYLKKFN
jgi:hypothetical protein